MPAALRPRQPAFRRLYARGVKRAEQRDVLSDAVHDVLHFRGQVHMQGGALAWAWFRLVSHGEPNVLELLQKPRTYLIPGPDTPLDVLLPHGLSLQLEGG